MTRAEHDRRQDLARQELATLVREHLLAGHLIDRAGMPLLLAHVSSDTMAEVAIEEWRGASPLYTRRMQRLLGFEGDDVATIFKGMQLDVGAPPQFLDFRYLVHDRDHGEFHLAHCGALMDVEPMGEELVHAMCHTIEDPTFPATACATNPRARVLPVHRPPRVPADRHPHCHWTVAISDEHDPEHEPVEAVRLATTRAASLALADPGAPVDDGAGRWRYDGELEADLDLASFAAPVLAAIDDEICLQGHLLVLSFLASVGARLGAEVAAALGRGQLTGVGAVVAGRLRDAFGLGDGPDDVAAMLDLHPAFRPRRYVDLRVVPGGGRAGALRIELHDAPALHEELAPTWAALLAGDPTPGGPLDAIVQAVQPRARCQPVLERDRPDGAVAAWDMVVVDEPAEEPGEVTLTRFSTGATFRFQDR